MEIENQLYYVAPRESMESILENGILTPEQVRKLILEKKLPEMVLGVSFKKIDSSNFPEFVSLTSNQDMVKRVAEQICFARTGKYCDSNFMAVGYIIDSSIRLKPEFRNEIKTQEMNDNCYNGECLFKGNIEKSLISPRCFAVRTI